MNVSTKGGIFVDGELHKQVRRTTRRNPMFVYLWALKPDRRQLIHKGGKP